MQTIDVVILGKQPILLHKYIVSSVSNPKTRVTKAKDAANYADEWKGHTYTNKDGFVVVPALNVLACIFDGAKGMKSGKTALTRLIYTSLNVQPFEIELLWAEPEGAVSKRDFKPITLKDVEKNDWLDMRGAVISGRRIDRVRTRVPEGWLLKFTINTLDDALTAEDIQKILINAGERAGLGDWRPSAPKKPGPYGTFEVLVPNK